MVERIGRYILEKSASVRAVPELIVGEAGAAVKFFDKASWPDNVKMYKSAKFDQNIPCGSRFMSIFTN